MDRFKTVRFLAAGAALVALSAFIFACGDDDDDDDSNGDPTSAATTATQADATATTDGGDGDAEDSVVTIQDNSFAPASLTVSAGTTVTWESANTNNPHTVVGTFAGESVESDTLQGTDTFEFTFEEAGTFDYICGIHGAAMSGSITVE